MQLIAVVPIVTNLGAAVLPTVLAAIGSLLAILLKPQELLRLCRQRPAAVGVFLAALALIFLAGGWWYRNATLAGAIRRPERSAPFRYDWTKIAENIIAQENAGRKLTSLDDASQPDKVPVPTTPATAENSESSTAPTSVATVDFQRRNYHGGKAPLHLTPRWAFQPEDTMFLSIPAFSEGKIFVAGCQADLGSYTGLLACLDAKTGKPIWQVTQFGDEPLKPFFSSPAITPDGKCLIIGEGLHTDRECALHCVDAATGALRWSIKTPLHIESSPAIFGDMVVVGAGAIEGKDGKPTTDPGFVLAARVSDGKELWRYAVNDPESSPAIDEQGNVYIGSGFNGNALVALRPETDVELHEKNLPRLLWRVPIAYPVTGAVTLAGDCVIVGAGNADVVHSNRNAQGLATAVDRNTGHTRWQTRFDDGVLGQIAAVDGKLICPVRTGEIAALDQATGEILWRIRISGTAPIMAGFAVSDEKIYAVSSDGYLAVVNAKDGSMLEKIYLNDPSKPGAGLTLSTPQLFAGEVFIGSETGGFRCFQQGGAE